MSKRALWLEKGQQFFFLQLKLMSSQNHKFSSGDSDRGVFLSDPIDLSSEQDIDR